MTKKIDNQPAEKPRRRRRKPEVAESEILDAAEGFLKERPFHEMTVDDVMSRTGLSRPSFYEYFRDRYQLVIKLTERLGDWNLSTSGPWLSGDADSTQDLRSEFKATVEFYIARGHLLQALADAATSDRQVRISYRKMVGRSIDAVAARIQAGIDRGLIRGIDPYETANALIFMNERYLIDRLGNHPQTDSEVVVKTLLTIWQRVLYGI